MVRNGSLNLPELRFDEPSVVALNVHTGKVVAIGHQALHMHEKTNPNLKTVRPLKDGVIADFNATELMLRGMIKKVKTSGSLFAPSLRMVICILRNPEKQNKTKRNDTDLGLCKYSEDTFA